jgi:hypothetical protein
MYVQEKCLSTIEESKWSPSVLSSRLGRASRARWSDGPSGLDTSMCLSGAGRPWPACANRFRQSEEREFREQRTHSPQRERASPPLRLISAPSGRAGNRRDLWRARLLIERMQAKRISRRIPAPRSSAPAGPARAFARTEQPVA